ncbi:membrane protein [Capnocytophaga sp. HP1101]
MAISESRTIKYLKSFYLRDYLTIFVGLVLYAVGITGFIIPNKIVTGGLAGICLIINYKTGIEIAISYWTINIILLLIGFKAVSKQFTYRTFLSISILSLFLWLGRQYLMPYFSEHPPLSDDFLTVIMGGLLCGTGLGLVYSANGSTGGTDIIGFVLTKYWNMSIARILLVVDVCIVLSSFFILEHKEDTLEKTIYGLILLPLMWQMVEIVINGARQSVQLFIFSKHYDEIANHINSELKRGCTIIDGIGWYSKSSQKIVIVIARRTESTSIFRLVRSIDPAAFVTKTNVMGVYGNGFDKLK